MSDNRKEWLSKAEIDYFSPFVSLWLACNSWYNIHYPDAGSKDRDKINKIKTDLPPRNLLMDRFMSFLGNNNPESEAFRSNLEQFSRALDNAGIKENGNGDIITFDNASCFPNTPRESLKITVKKTKRGNLRQNDLSRVIDLGTLTVTSDMKKLFAGVFEMIYQVRCCLVHGTIEPNDSTHNVVKYAYLLLWDLMHF